MSVSVGAGHPRIPLFSYVFSRARGAVAAALADRFWSAMVAHYNAEAVSTRRAALDGVRDGSVSPQGTPVSGPPYGPVNPTLE